MSKNIGIKDVADDFDDWEETTLFAKNNEPIEEQQFKKSNAAGKIVPKLHDETDSKKNKSKNKQKQYQGKKSYKNEQKKQRNEQSTPAKINEKDKEKGKEKTKIKAGVNNEVFNDKEPTKIEIKAANLFNESRITRPSDPPYTPRNIIHSSKKAEFGTQKYNDAFLVHLNHFNESPNRLRDRMRD